MPMRRLLKGMMGLSQDREVVSRDISADGFSEPGEINGAEEQNQEGIKEIKLDASEEEQNDGSVEAGGNNIAGMHTTLNPSLEKMWFLANPSGEAAIQVQNIEEFTWLNSSYSPVMKQLESQFMIDYYFKNGQSRPDEQQHFYQDIFCLLPKDENWIREEELGYSVEALSQINLESPIKVLYS
ncbi:hypothetical protein ABZP36_029366 [Zizania latifolia]